MVDVLDAVAPVMRAEQALNDALSTVARVQSIIEQAFAAASARRVLALGAGLALEEFIQDYLTDNGYLLTYSNLGRLIDRLGVGTFLEGMQDSVNGKEYDRFARVPGLRAELLQRDSRGPFQDLGFTYQQKARRAVYQVDDLFQRTEFTDFEDFLIPFLEAFYDDGDQQRPVWNEPVDRVGGVILTVEGVDPAEVIERFDLLARLISHASNGITNILRDVDFSVLRDVPTKAWAGFLDALPDGAKNDGGFATTSALQIDALDPRVRGFGQNYSAAPDFQRLGTADLIPALGNLLQESNLVAEFLGLQLPSRVALDGLATALAERIQRILDAIRAIQDFARLLRDALALSGVAKLHIPLEIRSRDELVQEIYRATPSRNDLVRVTRNPNDQLREDFADYPSWAQVMQVGDLTSTQHALGISRTDPDFAFEAAGNLMVMGLGIFYTEGPLARLLNGIFSDTGDTELLPFVNLDLDDVGSISPSVLRESILPGIDLPPGAIGSLVDVGSDGVPGVTDPVSEGGSPGTDVYVVREVPAPASGPVGTGVKSVATGTPVRAAYPSDDNPAVLHPASAALITSNGAITAMQESDGGYGGGTGGVPNTTEEWAPLAQLELGYDSGFAHEPGVHLVDFDIRPGGTVLHSSTITALYSGTFGGRVARSSVTVAYGDSYVVAEIVSSLGGDEWAIYPAIPEDAATTGLLAAGVMPRVQNRCTHTSATTSEEVLTFETQVGLLRSTVVTDPDGAVVGGSSSDVSRAVLNVQSEGHVHAAADSEYGQYYRCAFTAGYGDTLLSAPLVAISSGGVVCAPATYPPTAYKNAVDLVPASIGRPASGAPRNSVSRKAAFLGAGATYYCMAEVVTSSDTLGACRQFPGTRLLTAWAGRVVRIGIGTTADTNARVWAAQAEVVDVEVLSGGSWVPLGAAAVNYGTYGPGGWPVEATAGTKATYPAAALRLVLFPSDHLATTWPVAPTNTLLGHAWYEGDICVVPPGTYVHARGGAMPPGSVGGPGNGVSNTGGWGFVRSVDLPPQVTAAGKRTLALEFRVMADVSDVVGTYLLLTTRYHRIRYTADTGQWALDIRSPDTWQWSLDVVTNTLPVSADGRHRMTITRDPAVGTLGLKMETFSVGWSTDWDSSVSVASVSPQLVGWQPRNRPVRLGNRPRQLSQLTSAIGNFLEDSNGIRYGSMPLAILSVDHSYE